MVKAASRDRSERRAGGRAGGARLRGLRDLRGADQGAEVRAREERDVLVDDQQGEVGGRRGGRRQAAARGAGRRPGGRGWRRARGRRCARARRGARRRRRSSTPSRRSRSAARPRRSGATTGVAVAHRPAAAAVADQVHAGAQRRQSARRTPTRSTPWKTRVGVEQDGGVALRRQRRAAAAGAVGIEDELAAARRR